MGNKPSLAGQHHFPAINIIVLASNCLGIINYVEEDENLESTLNCYIRIDFSLNSILVVHVRLGNPDYSGN